MADGFMRGHGYSGNTQKVKSDSPKYTGHFRSAQREKHSKPKGPLQLPPHHAPFWGWDVNTNQWRGTLGVDALPSGAAAEGWCGQAPSRLLLLGAVNLPVIADPG